MLGTPCLSVTSTVNAQAKASHKPNRQSMHSSIATSAANHSMERPMTFLVKSNERTDTDGDALYWNAQYGWTIKDCASILTDAEWQDIKTNNYPCYTFYNTFHNVTLEPANG